MVSLGDSEQGIPELKKKWDKETFAGERPQL